MKVSDILTVAIRLEEEGERFYRELSGHFDGEIKKNFSRACGSGKSSRRNL
jgi:rubrerythrin